MEAHPEIAKLMEHCASCASCKSASKAASKGGKWNNDTFKAGACNEGKRLNDRCPADS